MPPPPRAPTDRAASQFTISLRQTGVVIRGSVRVRSAGSRLLARALATRKALSGGKSTAKVEVGRLSRATAGPGTVAFKVTLGATGRRALRRHGRLLIRLRLTVDPAAGPTYTGSRFVILRAG